MESKTYLSRYRIMLDQYEQPIRLRRDGATSTYKAFDSESSREVALEIIPTGSLRISAQSKLEGEADAAKRLQQINIPVLYDFGIEDNELIYASEMGDGVTAEQWVASHGPMPIGSALRISSQVVNALGAATFHGIFHPALNPANIMIVPGQTAEGEWPLIKVMKFIGPEPKHSQADATAAGVNDKINYVAPELFDEGAPDFASQIYSLGCTLWFLLSGMPPLAGAATVESATRVPTPVRQLITRMLAVNPADRPRDPVALHAEIEDCIAEVENKRVIAPPRPVAAVVPASTQREIIDPRPRRPFPWQPLAVAAALLLFGGLAAMLLPQVFRMHGAKREIGVPVGVPENVAAAAATNAPVPTRASSPAPIQPNESNGTEVAAAPGVLTSTAGGDENAESDSANLQDSSTPQEQPAQVVSNTVPQPSAAPEQSPAPLIASNSAQPQVNEPAPPSEGPEATPVTSPSAVTNAYANASPDENELPKTATASAQAPARIVRHEETADTEKKPSSSAKESRRVTKSDRPVAVNRRLRDGRVRAQYLGTTPEGELVFGLPSDERAYLNPNAATQRRESSPRNRRRVEVRPAEPPDDLPVLPALPPDQ